MQQNDGDEIDNNACKLHKHHLKCKHVDLSVNVEHLDQDKRREGDHHNIGERVTEHKEAEHKDASALKDRLPKPNTERFDVHGSSLFQRLV